MPNIGDKAVEAARAMEKVTPYSTDWEQSQSPSIGKLAGALAAAQGEMAGAAQDKENPFFRSKYADLSSVWEACRKPLANNKLAVIQTMVPNGSERVCVKTTLAHESGEFISGVLSVRPVRSVKNSNELVTSDDPQAMGSAITYARRYSLAAIVGVAPEDDDGEKAQGRTPPSTKTQPRKQPPKQNPQQKADAETKAQMKWDAAIWETLANSGHPDSLGVWNRAGGAAKIKGKTKATIPQQKKFKESVLSQIDDWRASKDEPQKMFINKDQQLHLINTAQTAMDHLGSVQDVLDWVKGTLKNFTDLQKFEQITVDEYQGLIETLDIQTGGGS